MVLFDFFKKPKYEIGDTLINNETQILYTIKDRYKFSGYFMYILETKDRLERIRHSEYDVSRFFKKTNQ